MKHGEHILAIDNQYLIDSGFNEGFNSPTAGLCSAVFGEAGTEFLTYERRKELEANFKKKQILPYALISRYNQHGVKTYLTYQRAKGVGEQRLLGLHSIGLGGHVELHDADSSGDRLSMGGTVHSNLRRELQEELRLFVCAKTNVDIDELLNKKVDQVLMHGFIFAHDTAVDSLHLGLVYELELPSYIYAELAEVELEFKGWHTAAELACFDGQFETWSRLVIENLNNLQ